LLRLAISRKRSRDREANEPHRRDGAHRRRVRKSGAYAPLSNFQTGMPSFLALSARFAEMPEPGNTMTPIGTTASIWSLRRNGAALAWRVQSGLKAIWVTLRALARSGALRAAAVEQHHAGMLGVNLVETVPDRAVVVKVETAWCGPG
jgi:hypothetical protein